MQRLVELVFPQFVEQYSDARHYVQRGLGILDSVHLIEQQPLVLLLHHLVQR